MSKKKSEPMLNEMPPVDPDREPIEYEELHKIVSFEGFDYRNYIRHEQSVLTPRLERKGFTDIKFLMGEQDSFGPLTRVCHATDAEGKRRHFIYG